MKLFKCQDCGQMLYFENVLCENCGHRLGYLPDIGVLSAVYEDGNNWIALANPDMRYRFCANWEAYACNWMVLAGGEHSFCTACQHNRKIPDISNPERHRLWQKLELAKKRLFYGLIKFKLPMPTESSGDEEPLAFQFLADDGDGLEDEEGNKLMTGHANGTITILLSEADDAERERARTRLDEPYRTLLGHFRHEVGHYYWDKLIRDGGKLESFRALFGDEQLDYQQALKQHYENGAPPGWQNGYVSAYATSHPWEDWAESWAHYLHIVDTLEMAGAFGIKVKPAVTDDPELKAVIEFNSYRTKNFKLLIETWLPLAFAANSLNRSMGQPDLYPFVLAPHAIEKMGYIHDVIHGIDPSH